MSPPSDATRTAVTPDAVAQAAPVAPVHTLEMGSETSQLVFRHGDPTPWVKEYPLGVDTLVRQCFHHALPRPIELEHAIEVTEEVVIAATATHAAPQWSDRATLVLAGLGATLLRQALHDAGIVTQVLTTDAVESLFNRVVSLSEGRPASQDALPSDVRFCAALLMLRECMHHLNFQQVMLLPV
jgi:hypothetical protein